jgi:adenylate kinase
LIAKKINESDGTTIIDTHMIIKTPEGYWAGLPLNTLHFLNPDNLVLIEAEPSEVLHRRFKDKTRRRDPALEQEIVEEFSFSRLVAASCAVVTGASIKIVENNDGKVVEAAKEILGLLE